MDDPSLGIIHVLNTIQENDKVFVYCNQNEPLFLNVKTKRVKDLEDSKKIFVIFESESYTTKLGIKVIDNKLHYSKFNTHSGCLKIDKIIYNTTSDEYKELLHKTLTKKLQIKVDPTKQIKVLKQNIELGDIALSLIHI